MSDSHPNDLQRNVSCRLTPSAAARVRRRHPWVFEDGITRVSHGGAAGDVAVLYDPKNKFLGAGLFDPSSPIRVRVFQFGKGTPPGPELFADRLAAAAALRAPIIADPQTTGYRLVHGPNDGLPGLVVDVYGEHAVVKLYSECWLPWFETMTRAVREVSGVQHMVLRLARGPRPAYAERGIHDGQTVGLVEPAEQPVMFAENGLRFEADLIRGQKTGFFLDQRENRARVERLSTGKSVLNVFAYTGGFSLYAARGGATQVVSLDLSAPACLAAERNFALNLDDPNVAKCAHRTIAADAFESMRDLHASGHRFDIVIVDPPSFAKRASETEGALRAYGRLATLAAQLLSPGGVLVLASCSSRVSADDFEATALSAARTVVPGVAVFERSTHPLDHPIAFSESAYLKCVFTRA